MVRIGSTLGPLNIPHLDLQVASNARNATKLQQGAAVTESTLFEHRQRDEKRQQQPAFAGAAAALTVCASVWGLPLAASAAEVYEGMYISGQAGREIADVGQSMDTAQTKINKVGAGSRYKRPFFAESVTCAADANCNDDLAGLRDDMQSAVRNSQGHLRSSVEYYHARIDVWHFAHVAIRSAGKNAEYDPKAAELMFIADEFDCIEIRRDKSTAFLVNKFGAAKVGAGVLGADHTKEAYITVDEGKALVTTFTLPTHLSVVCAEHTHPHFCGTKRLVDVMGNSMDVKGNIVDVNGNSVDVKDNSVDADALFGKGPKTSVLAKEGLPTISKAAAIIDELKSALLPGRPIL
eukprot:1193553-Prorocentrum_minimum.AAC.2